MSLLQMSRLAPGPTQHPFQWLPGALTLRKSGWSVGLTTNVCLISLCMTLYLDNYFGGGASPVGGYVQLMPTNGSWISLFF